MFTAIDTYNSSSLCKKFIKDDTINLISIPEIDIIASMTGVNDIEISPAASGNETYPSHVVLPVMIYVGQKKRELL